MEAPWKTIWPEWQLIRRIGQGSCGTVYQARNQAGAEAAIKVIVVPQNDSETDILLSDGMTPDEIRCYYREKAEELLSEVRLSVRLCGHPNIVQVDDYAVQYREDGFGAMVVIRTELLIPLTVYMADKTLTQADIIRLGCDICSALSACYSQKLLHRDIKPENILVDDKGNFKLGDFGLARRLESSASVMTSVGTPLYIAPEIAAGSAYDERTDIYSLGLILYRFLNRNRLPFMNDKRLSSPADRRRAMEWRLKGESIPAPADASSALAKTILKACAFQPKNRFSSAEMFKKALKRAEKQPAKTNRWLIPAVAGGILLTAGFSAFFFASEHFNRNQAETTLPYSVETAIIPSSSSAPLPQTAASSESLSLSAAITTAPEESIPSASDPVIPVSYPAYYTDSNAGLCRFSLNPDGVSWTITGLWETAFFGDFEMPDLYKQLPVTALSSIALKSLSIDEGNLYLPESLTALDPYVLAGCYINGTVVVGGSVKRIGERAFYESVLGTVLINDGCEQIDWLAFEKTTAEKVVIPASVQNMDNAFLENSRIGVLEIHSEAVLNRWLAGENVCFFSVKEIVLGPEITDYTVKDGCLIHCPTNTLVKTCTGFRIPSDGSVDRIASFAIYIPGNGEEPLPETVRIPEGVLEIDSNAILLKDWTHVLNWNTQPFVMLPASLETIFPDSFPDTCVASWPGSKAEWIALTQKTPHPPEEYYGSKGTFWVYCSDGKLAADAEGYWRPLYD